MIKYFLVKKNFQLGNDIVVNAVQADGVDQQPPPPHAHDSGKREHP